MSNIALIIAGGSGNRMGQDIPKQFINVFDKPVLIYTLESFQKHPQIDAIEVVCIEGWESIVQAYANQFNIRKLKWIFPGGETGMQSIRNGIYGLRDEGCSDDDLILIHDSVIHKQIEDYAFDKLLDLYEESGKQIFIAMDKQNSFGEEVEKKLEDAAVLHLSKGGNELYGAPWYE